MAKPIVRSIGLFLAGVFGGVNVSTFGDIKSPCAFYSFEANTAGFRPVSNKNNGMRLRRS